MAHEHGDGNDTDNGDAPLWLRAAYKFGLPGAIAAFLVYFMTMGVGKDLTSIKDKLDATLSNTSKQHMEQSYYLRAICINLATTEAQRAICTPPADNSK